MKSIPQEITVEAALVELDNLDDEVAVWKPEVGDDMVGMVLEYEAFQSKFETGKTLQMVTLRTADGFRRLVIGQVALRGLFSRLQPKVGESIKLKRHSDGERARRYRMRVIGRPANMLVPDFGNNDESTDTGGGPEAVDNDADGKPDEDLAEAIPF